MANTDNAKQLILSKEGAHYRVILEPDETDEFLIKVRRERNGGTLINERMIIRPDLQQHIEFYTSRGFSLQTV